MANLPVKDKISSKKIIKSSYERKRNIPNYLDKISQKSKGTIKNVNNHLSRFDSYLVATYGKPNEAVLNEILSFTEDKRYRAIFDVLQDYVNFLSGKTNHLGTDVISSGYVRASTYSIKGYLRFFGFKITSEDVSDSVTLPRIIEEERVPLTRKILQAIINNSTGLRRIMYLVMTSSGLRPSEVLQLRKRDFNLNEYARVLIKVPAKITKTKKPRITFISEETERLLRPILDNLDDSVQVFNQSNRTMEQVRLSEEQIFGRLREKLGFKNKYDSGIYHVSLGDSFRSWFVTKCNRIDFGFGHALAGHESYMKRYDRIELKDKVDYYIRAEKSLQVNTYLDDEKLEKMSEVYLKRITDLEAEMDSVRELLKRIKKS